MAKVAELVVAELFVTKHQGYASATVILWTTVR